MKLNIHFVYAVLLLSTLIFISIFSMSATSQSTSLVLESSSINNNPQPGINFQLQNNGTKVKLQANNMYMFHTQNQFRFNVTWGGEGELCVNETYKHQYQNELGNIYRIGPFIEIDLNDTSIPVQARLGWKYNLSEISPLYHDYNYSFMYYNEYENLSMTKN